MCSLKNTFIRGLEVSSPLSNPSIAMATGGASILTLAITDVDNRTLLFAGRADGSLMTVSLCSVCIHGSQSEGGGGGGGD